MSMTREINELRQMPVPELVNRYREAFGLLVQKDRYHQPFSDENIFLPHSVLVSLVGLQKVSTEKEFLTSMPGKFRAKVDPLFHKGEEVSITHGVQYNDQRDLVYVDDGAGGGRWERIYKGK